MSDPHSYFHRENYMISLDLKSLFPDAIDPNTISVFEGRIVNIPDSFPDDGILYVDIIDPNDSNVENGKKRAYQARSSNIMLNYYNAWDSPPEIRFKSKFSGSMSATTSGDFHLRNYCFDMMTQTWFMTVSTALNALGIINIPPVMVSLDLTPFPGQAVAISLAPTAEEVMNKSVSNALRDLKTDRDTSGSVLMPSKADIKSALHSTRFRSRSSDTTTDTTTDMIVEAIKSIARMISDKLGNLIEQLLYDFTTFFLCIDKIFRIYKKYVNNSTFPVTQYAKVLSNGELDIPDSEELANLKSSIGDKLVEFSSFANDIKGKITTSIDEFISEKISDIIYEPIAILFSTIESTITSITDPIKKKLVEIIESSVKSPLSKITSILSNAIQPIIASLPTIVQLIVKVAMDKLLNLIMGKPVEFLLKAVGDPITNIIDKAVDFVMGKISDIISMSFGTLVRPALDLIAENLGKLTLPTGFVNKFSDLLDQYLDGEREFPKFNINQNLDKATGELSTKLEKLDESYEYITIPEEIKVSIKELDWSNPEHIKVFLMTLFSVTSEENTGGSLRSIKDDSDDQEIKTFVIEEHAIYGANTTSPSGYSPSDFSNFGSYNYEEFDRKSIMDLFLQRFEEVLIDVRTTDYNLDNRIPNEDGKPDLEIKTWQTNNYKYAEFDDIIYLIGNGGALLGDDGLSYTTEDTVFYLATKIEHKSNLNESMDKYLVFDDENVNSNDTNVGEDLVLEIKNGNPQKLTKVKRDDGSKNIKNKGKKLYKYKPNSLFKSEYQIAILDPSKEYIIDDLLETYFAPIRECGYSEDGIIKECNTQNKDEFKQSIDGNRNPNFIWELEGNKYVNWDTSCFKKVIMSQNNWKNNIFISTSDISLDEFTFNNASISYDPHSPLFYKKYTNLEGEEKIVKMSPSDSDYVEKFFVIKNTLGECLLYNGKSNFYSASFLKENTLQGMQYKLLIDSKSNGGDDQQVNITNITRLPEPKSFLKKFRDVASGKYFAWTQLTNKDRVFTETQTRRNNSDEDSSNGGDEKFDKLVDIFSKVMNVIGQDGDLSLDIVFSSQINNMLEPLNQISGSLSNIDSVINPVLEMVDELKDISSIAGKVGEITSKVNDIADTVAPIMEATAKAASAVALQSCSMSQSANGKDFSFSSGNEYSLSTTSESKSQLPYCKSVLKEKLLNVGDKCLVLSIGGGKGNLMVIDIMNN